MHSLEESQPDLSSNSEGEQRGITRLVIVAHPFFINIPTFLSLHDQQPDRKALEEQIVLQAQVQDPTDVVVVMPLIDVTPQGNLDWNDYWKERERIAQAKRVVPDWVNWPELFRHLQDQSPYPQNIQLGYNLYNNIIPAERLEERLHEKGFVITPDTDITICGEWTNECVGGVAAKVLQLPQVQQVTIDKRASHSSAYLLGMLSAQISWRHFYAGFRDAGYNLKEDLNTIRISKPA